MKPQHKRDDRVPDFPPILSYEPISSGSPRAGNTLFLGAFLLAVTIYCAFSLLADDWLLTPILASFTVICLRPSLSRENTSIVRSIAAIFMILAAATAVDRLIHLL
jgi:hypothetical protein